jgi:hypothetical protein
MRRLIISVSVITLAAIGSVTGARPAHAATTGSCPSATLSQPFLPWADPAWYRRLPNAGFERYGRAWSLVGARVVADNEPFYVNSETDSLALNLGDSGSATSSTVCVGALDPTLRLFVRNTGSPLSLLQVSVVFTDADGLLSTVPVGLVAAGADWQPTLPIAVGANALSLVDGSTNVAFRFTAVGLGGDWTIDDVYLDPFKTK